MGRTFNTNRAVQLAILAVLVLFGATAHAANSKRVVLLHSFGRDYLPWSDYSKAIRAELERQSPWPLDISDHSLMSARGDDGDAERPFIAYLRAYYTKKPPDLIVSIGAPAAIFVQRYRQELFPRAPMLLTAVEQRRVDPSLLSKSDAVAAVSGDLTAFMETLLRVLPETKTVAYVNGSSPSERFWRQEIARVLKPYENRVSFVWWSDFSFDDMLTKAATLPPHSAIVWQLLNVDGAGVSHEGDAALNRMRAAANAPIFTYQGAYFGDRIVGGPMYSVQEVSEAAASVAIRLLGGEDPATIEVQPVGFAKPKYDWREMQRWDISESRLPPASEIYFRQPTLWEQYRWPMLAIIAALMLQTALIAWLVSEHRRRSLAEVQSRNAMAELAHLNRIETAGQLSASIAHEINQPITGIVLKASAALRWIAVEKPDMERIRSVLTEIIGAGQRAGDIITGVRAMFKKDMNARATINLNNLIKTVLALLQLDLQKDEVRVEAQLEETLPSVTGDAVQLQQVILNLIVNAAEAMRATEPRILKICSNQTPGGTVCLAIEDSGPGIADAARARIFDPLFTTKSGGMGMGLSICRSIIENHGGKIWVEQAAGGGALFRFELPAAQTPTQRQDRAA
jgi:signal transduction histidine kinase